MTSESNNMMSALKVRAMRRVYVIWCLRQLFSPILVKMYILTALIFQSIQYISITNVFQNAAPHFTYAGRALDFFTYAFMHTEMTVQILFAGMATLSLWLARDIVLNIPLYHKINPKRVWSSV